MPPRLSRWAWTADVALALVLSVGTVVADLDRSFFEPRQDAPQEIGPNGVGPREIGPPPPGRPGIAEPGSPLFPEPGSPRVPEPGSPLFPEPGSPGVPERDGTGREVPPPAYEYPPPPVIEHVLPPARSWELALAALTALPLVLRRRYPLTAFCAVLAAASAFHLGEVARGATAFAFAAGVVGAYSAVMYSPYRRRALVGLVAGVPLFAAAGVVPEVGRGFVPLLVLLPIGLAANAIHTWQQRLRALQEQQEAATRLAVDQERSRIARELHDVVTHNVSMMTIQAGAARKVLDTSPEQAREAMSAVEAAGRAAMAELRHVMGLLTMAATTDPALDVDLAPQPGLGQLAALAGRVRDTGVPVELSVTGTPEAPLPAGVDLAAYRVVQEALTNAVKHAAGASVAVAVAHAPGELRVEVTDTGGRTTARAAAGSGRGLIGLRERLAVYGGTLQATPRPHGGYRVRALIPLPDPPPEEEPARHGPGGGHAPGLDGGAVQT
ncbi:hypothetical protein GCM10010400_30070 [Streptomyces aculeolatus]